LIQRTDLLPSFGSHKWRRRKVLEKRQRLTERPVG
jgi:hypothetical protein